MCVPVLYSDQEWTNLLDFVMIFRRKIASSSMPYARGDRARFPVYNMPLKNGATSEESFKVEKR